MSDMRDCPLDSREVQIGRDVQDHLRKQNTTLQEEVARTKAYADQLQAEIGALNDALRIHDICQVKPLVHSLVESMGELAVLLREARRYLTTGVMFRQDTYETELCKRIDAVLSGHKPTPADVLNATLRESLNGALSSLSAKDQCVLDYARERDAALVELERLKKHTPHGYVHKAMFAGQPDRDAAWLMRTLYGAIGLSTRANQRIRLIARRLNGGKAVLP